MSALAIDLRGDPGADLSGVVGHLRAGGLIAYPTETVYGLGGATNEEAVARVQALKRRERDKPLIALVASRLAVSDLAWTDAAIELAKIFWPGALTLVLADPLGLFPDGVRSAAGSVAIRVSPSPVVARLVDELGGAITSTSLNSPGDPPARSGSEAAEVLERLGESDVVVIDGGRLPPSGPSTIVDCTGVEPTVLRAGSVPLERLRCALPEIHGERRG